MRKDPERISDDAEAQRLLPIMVEILELVGASKRARRLEELDRAGGIARILVVDEVELDVVALARLADRKIAAANLRAEDLDRILCDQFRRRAPVEEALQQIATGKRGPLSSEEAGQLAARLGVPSSPW